MPDSKSGARKRADDQMKRASKAQAGAKLTVSQEQDKAVRERTARLKALRLAKEAAEGK